MGYLTELREELVEAMSGLDLNLYTHIPGRLVLPGAWVMAGAPYIEQGQTFEEKVISYWVVVCVPTGTNQTETSGLDDLIEAIQDALETYETERDSGWIVESVAQPEAMSLNNTEFLAASIAVTTSVTLS